MRGPGFDVTGLTGLGGLGGFGGFPGMAGPGTNIPLPPQPNPLLQPVSTSKDKSVDNPAKRVLEDDESDRLSDVVSDDLNSLPDSEFSDTKRIVSSGRRAKKQKTKVITL